MNWIAPANFMMNIIIKAATCLTFQQWLPVQSLPESRKTRVKALSSVIEAVIKKSFLRLREVMRVTVRK